MKISSPEQDARNALKSVVTSELFSASPRLQEFLSYIVEEALSGRDQKIKGKTIAVDVYKRDLNADGDAQNLVRVEARRLRRLLAEYYETEGRGETLQITIPSGGYVPSFIRYDQSEPEAIQESEQSASGRWLQRLNPVAIVITVFALISVGTLVFWKSDQQETSSDQADTAVRESLRERSVPALQAANLAEQARGMLFPIFDARRQQLALEMFQHVVELEPGISHGYAGAAQVLAALSLISPDHGQAGDFLADARNMAEKAIDLAPSDAWANGALGWTHAVAGEFEDSLKHARLALELAPEDGHVLDLVGIAAILSGNPELAADASDPSRIRSGVGRFGARNIWGLSQYMLGDYSATVEAFSGAAAAGAPVSPPSLVFLAVAHDHLGNDNEARKLVEELSSTWPDLPIGFLVRRIFQEGSGFERDIIQRLRKYDTSSSLLTS